MACSRYNNVSTDLRTSNVQVSFVRVLTIRVSFVCLAITLFSACTPSISPFSQAAYEYAVELKVESLKLMDLAEFSYIGQSKKIDALKLKLDKAYEFAHGRPRNEHAARQWQILLDRDRNLLGGFFVRWDSLDHLDRTFIVESKHIIAGAFDTIIGLESGKIRGIELQTNR